MEAVCSSDTLVMTYQATVWSHNLMNMSRWLTEGTQKPIPLCFEYHRTNVL